MDIYDANGQKVEREVHESNLENDAAEKGKFRHFMQKKYYEQPNALNQHNGRTYPSQQRDCGCYW